MAEDEPVRCPFCASGEVYSLLDTLHCKRCKGVWTGEMAGSDTGDQHCPGQPPLPAKKAEPLTARLEKELDRNLRRSRGRFRASDAFVRDPGFSREVFRRYLFRCVRDRVLSMERDRHGQVWFFRT